MKYFSFFALVIAVPILSHAHSGGLNAQGCHAGSQPYHCHRSPSDMVGNRLRCDLGSRSTECSGNSKTTSSKPKITASERRRIVLSFQKKLMEHCPSLPSNFADGLFGVLTQRALIEFQIAYGLEVNGKYNRETALALAGEVNGNCK